MLNYEKAKKLAQIWIDLNGEVETELVEEETSTKPYGWIFFYQSKRFLQTGDFSDMLAGNAPILIDGIKGELKVFGTANTIEEYLRQYEITLPPALLQISPEYPPENL